MNNQTFSLPSSIDSESVTLFDVWEHHGYSSTHHPLFQCNLGKIGDTGSVITWGDAICAMHAAGRIILDALVESRALYPSTDIAKRPVVGILAVSGQCQNLFITQY